jgi:integrase
MAKNRTKLTEAKVKAFEPPASGRLALYDEEMPGLVLRVNRGGAKSWAALHYVKTVAKTGKLAGQPITMPTMHKLGRWPHLSLAEARAKARLFLSDPRKALTDGVSFEDIANSYLARHVIANGLRSRTEIERALNKYVLPEWRQRPFASIRRAEVAKLIDHVVTRHGRRQADLVLAYLRAMMNWFAARSDDYVNPIVRGMGRNGNESRDRVLSDDEIAALWSLTGEGPFGGICRMLLLTAQRLNKVVTMEWTHVADGVWKIATEAREKGNAGELVLPEMALAIVNAQPRIAREPRVFTGCCLPDRKAELDQRMAAALGRPVEDWRLHDLRRTARTLMARAGVAPHVAEATLGHALRGVEGVYQRHSYVAEKQQALKALAALVAGIVAGPTLARGAPGRRA